MNLNELIIAAACTRPPSPPPLLMLVDIIDTHAKRIYIRACIRVCVCYAALSLYRHGNFSHQAKPLPSTLPISLSTAFQADACCG